ncbi:hypothetical protein SDC9_132187 [bioreactor metagenome]|uniref:Uncharacterized protein n=1 Tax=bioreactor metagenome TaxID=1076179 RepID=A0A645D6G5_9ZZZZ
MFAGGGIFDLLLQRFILALGGNLLHVLFRLLTFHLGFIETGPQVLHLFLGFLVPFVFLKIGFLTAGEQLLLRLQRVGNLLDLFEHRELLGQHVLKPPELLKNFLHTAISCLCGLYEILQSSTAFRVPEPPEGLGFDLPDTFTRHLKIQPDLLECQ